MKRLSNSLLKNKPGVSRAPVFQRAATAYSLPPGARRGVLLLVVLSLLVLFALIGITFVLVASQSRRISRADSRGEQYGDDYRKQLDEVFAQIVRDTTNPQSVLQGHSLLNDMYGTDGATGIYTSVAYVPAGVPQFLDIQITSIANLPNSIYPVSTQVQTPGYYNGCVLTMVDGPAANLSARIVGWGYNTGSTQYTARVMAFDSFDSSKLIGLTGTYNLLINGRPFNGTGFGLQPKIAFVKVTADILPRTQGATAPINGGPAVPATAINQTDFTMLAGSVVMASQDPTTMAWSLNSTALGATDNKGNPYALMPNPKYFQPNGAYAIFGGIGGADEDYDAVDPQNMLLAYVPPNPTIGTIIPSLHRPDLAQYWINKTWSFNPIPPAVADVNMPHKVMLRPIGPSVASGGIPQVTVTSANLPSGFVGHANFTGSNAGNSGLFDPVNGPWDVDNDGDGIADSVWVDVGLPVQTAPDGRRFKPLAAILCLDLDGRLNVNAHGNVVQADQNYSTPIPVSGGLGAPTIADYAFASGGTAVPVQLPRGQGYGPAEINLGVGGIFASPTIDYPSFFKGQVINSKTYEGRYGKYTGSATVPPLPGSGGLGPDDTLDSIKRFDFPTPPTPYNYYTSLNDYGSPSDLWGRSVVALDYAGQPITSFLNSPPLNSGTPATANLLGGAAPETPGDPYTINLSRNRTRSGGDPPTTKDNPFAASELERILRKFDIDVTMLPERLKTLLDPLGTNPADVARLITTDSYDLPSPSILPTKDMAANLAAFNGGKITPSQSITDLLGMKMLQYQINTLIAAGIVPTPALVQSMMQTIGTQAAAMLPPEVVAGMRFDLNRPFGNGQDDDGNGVVDEPTFNEFTKNGAGNNESPSNWSTVFGAAVPLDLNNDGTVVPPTNNPSTTPTNSDIYARQQYAKHLYIMMMLLVDQTYQFSQEAGVTGTSLIPGMVSQQQELLARRIAQWAVNVVDFRDADSIMTPFEYDVNPFNGWDDVACNGVLGQPEDSDPVQHPDRRLVWGCENPDLLLTEAMALHDRRVRDSPSDNGKNNDMQDSKNNMNPDVDYDQFRVPQGSVFFELFCPRKSNGTQGGYSGDVYAGGQLNLAAVAPAGVSGLTYPVWRIAITGSTVSLTSPAPNDIYTRINSHPDTGNLDPSGTATTDSYHGSVFDAASTPGPATIERLVWFTNSSPNISPAEASISYYNKLGAAPLLSPGQYALVGPRPLTSLGRTTSDTVPTNQAQIQLSPAVAIFDSTGTNIYTTNSILQPLAIICVGTALPTITTPVSATAWDATLAPNGIGVSITEPLFSSPSYYATPATADPDLKYLTPIDKPLDDSAVTPLGSDKLIRTTILQTGTQQNYKTVLLQRLANPLAAYDPVVNPYITVSWQPIDLTVFNGDALQPTGVKAKPDPDDPANFSPISPLPLGDRQMGPATATVASLVGASPTLTPVNRGSNNLVFDYNIPNTLGFLNSAWGTPWKNPPTALAGYQGVPDPTTSTFTFSWPTWNNRPFVSNMELLLVPATSAEQLVRQFSSTPQLAPNPYSPALGAFQLPCGHLLNFLLSSDGSAAGGTGVGVGAPNFYRVLDYVHVPSRFVGTDTYLNPGKFAAALPSASGLTETDLVSYYHPPFNKVSNYRDPGRVNINTIPSDTVWTAILNGGPGPDWLSVTTSRVNGATPGSSPTLMANPFRSAAGAAYALPGTPPITSEINATLLRPLFTNPFVPLFNSTALTGIPSVDPDRNPYFRYESLERLSNMLTTRSNVYAVWITVGYFEVTPAPHSPPGGPNPNYAIYPDGYQLGQELGSDSGDIKRHRAFYIYDRSIPVGFEPGHDHNFDKGVLLKRFIE